PPRPARRSRAPCASSSPPVSRVHGPATRSPSGTPRRTRTPPVCSSCATTGRGRTTWSQHCVAPPATTKPPPRTTSQARAPSSLVRVSDTTTTAAGASAGIPDRTPTPIDAVAEAYVTRVAELDPISATAMGLSGYDHLVTDLSPAGHEARAEADRAVL